MRLLPVLALALFAVAPRAARADDATRDPAVGRFITRDTYDGDGAFVEWPAQAVGMTTLILVGSTATFVCLPYDLLAGGVGRASFGSFAAFCGRGLGAPAGNAAYLAGGAPFWLVRQAAWVQPRRILPRRR